MAAAAPLARFAGTCLQGSLAAAIALAALLFPGGSLDAADRVVTVEYVEYVEYEAGDGAWPAPSAAADEGALADYGPFHVVSATEAELVGDTDSYSPDDFREMLAAWPGLRTLRLVECGGTLDDVANLELARMIRRAGLATHIPAYGSVRSGGVELFLAGVSRSAEPGAEFLVHSWRDEWGREAWQVPAGDPAHADYLGYYREIGLSPERARAFYALTNSVPHSSTRRVTLGELADFQLLN